MIRPPGIGRRWFFAAITVALFFALVELFLAAIGVRTVLDERDPFQGFSGSIRVWELDPERDRYRTPRRAMAHSFNYQEFDAAKPANGFRIFVLGGSSAFGFPWGATTAFPDPLGRALQAVSPRRKIETVNAAAMSYGSHRLRILTDEVLRHEPDLLVIYGGHNEFVERRFYSEFIERPQRWGVWRTWLARSRIHAVMDRALARLRGDDSDQEPAAAVSRTTGELLGLDVDREDAVDVGRAEAERVRGLFETNLQAILDRARAAAVSVVLCTVPSNLRDWKPNRSYFEPSVGFEDRQEALGLIDRAQAALQAGETLAAVAALERARALAPGYAQTHYLLGRAYEVLERWDAARAAFRAARDTDAQPSRATTAINDTIRDLAERNGALLFDAEGAFERAAPHGLIGFDLLEDYVHPRPNGHRLIAEGLWHLLLAQGLPDPPEPGAAPDFGEALGSSPPSDADRRPTPTLLFNLAVVLENQGAIAEAEAKYREVLTLQPGFAIARANLAGLLYNAGRFAEASEEYRRALEDNPGHAKTMVALGESLNSLGDLDAAERVLRRATEVDPAYAGAWNSLGSVLIRRRRVAEAETAFRRAVELDPADVLAVANLGYSLLFQDRMDEARAAFERGVGLQPDHLRSRDGLAAVLTEQGRLDEAERIFRENLAVDPGDSVARSGLERIERLRHRD